MNRLMNVTTRPADRLDMVQFHINTGKTYDGPQIVIASLLEASWEKDSETVQLIFQIVDNSRCIYEKVAINATWPQIKGCQNDTIIQKNVDGISKMIMNEYMHSRYVY